MISGLVKAWKEAVVATFQIFQHFPGGTKGNYGKRPPE